MQSFSQECYKKEQLKSVKKRKVTTPGPLDVEPFPQEQKKWKKLKLKPT